MEVPQPFNIIGHWTVVFNGVTYAWLNFSIRSNSFAPEKQSESHWEKFGKQFVKLPIFDAAIFSKLRKVVVLKTQIGDVIQGAVE